MLVHTHHIVKEPYTLRRCLACSDYKHESLTLVNQFVRVVLTSHQQGKADRLVWSYVHSAEAVQPFICRTILPTRQRCVPLHRWGIDNVGLNTSNPMQGKPQYVTLRMIDSSQRMLRIRSLHSHIYVMPQASQEQTQHPCGLQAIAISSIYLKDT